MWETDATSVLTAEGTATVFVLVDHYTQECLGIHAARRGTRFEALEPRRQAIRSVVYGGFTEGCARGLSLRHDHGSQYISRHFQKELAFLGISSSPSFVREPEGNGCTERFNRILKEQLLWRRRFTTVDALNDALQEFKEQYNTHWRAQRHHHMSPLQARIEAMALKVAS